MALYRATIYKQHTASGERWSNVYTIQETSIDNAKAAANTCRLAEQAVSYNVVNFYKQTVKELVPGGATRQSSPNENGSLSPTGLGGILPLFCTVRVTFTNLTGKPEQKYLRLAANEANLSNGVWDGEFTLFIETYYADVLLGLPQYVGPNGEAHVGELVHSEVQNRQLGWHRRFRPGFKRGWVAA